MQNLATYYDDPQLRTLCFLLKQSDLRRGAAGRQMSNAASEVPHHRLRSHPRHRHDFVARTSNKTNAINNTINHINLKYR